MFRLPRLSLAALLLAAPALFALWPLPAHAFCIGLYINGHERTGGDYARITPMVELPGVAGAGGDERLFVWRGTIIGLTTQVWYAE